MQSRFVYGLKLLFSALAAAVLGAHSAAAQDEATNEQLTLELRQIRAEVDFLRNQLETGGGVADVAESRGAERDGDDDGLDEVFHALVGLTPKIQMAKPRMAWAIS